MITSATYRRGNKRLPRLWQDLSSVASVLSDATHASNAVTARHSQRAVWVMARASGKPRGTCDL